MLASDLRRRVAWLAAGASLVLGLRLAGVPALERLLPLRPGEGTRLEIWRGTLDLASRQPLLGVGVYAFPYAYAGNGRPVADRLVDTAENDFLQAGAEGGIALVALLLLAARSALRSLRARRSQADAAGRRASSVALAGLVGLLPITLTGSPLHAPSVALAAAAAWALAGLLASPAEGTPSEAAAAPAGIF